MYTTESLQLRSAAVIQQNDITEFKDKNEYERKINHACRRAEPECIEILLKATELPQNLNEQIQNLAAQLSQDLRERKQQHGKAGLVQGLLQEFSLSSQEGIALMCLAEALLRIPDKATRDLLIKDKINQGNWKDHLGQSQLMFVNAAAWGLMLTGKLMETPKQKSLAGLLTNLLARSGRGIIRKAVDAAMRMMGEQFVTGENIHEALHHAEAFEKKGFRYSYDMLGEAALTAADAERYYQDYTQAIHAIGQPAFDQDVYTGPGISIKLSALHPRYQRSQIERVHHELYPKVLKLALLAKHYNIGLNIDAEESERLAISLELLERLCFEPELADWNGIGFVIQAYQKRCFYVVDYLIDLAKRSQKRLMIRLVKGAYWDSEIKKAQIDGMTDYPVFTRKVHTDLSYLACARKLLAAPEQIYPQFATHNAQTLATIYHMAQPEHYYAGQYEFQCLHGMGEELYENVVGEKSTAQLGIPCRIYAPVGNHETLLAYLVRRLLENGANTSFVNRIADPSLAIEELIEDPRSQILKNAEHEAAYGQKHPAIPLPKDLYALKRQNAIGFDLADDHALLQLNTAVAQFGQQHYQAVPLGLHSKSTSHTSPIKIINPAQHNDVVGTVIEATSAQVETALNNAVHAQEKWLNTATEQRAEALLHAADLIQKRLLEFMVLLSRESGKTYANALAEIREAIDFLRYYAGQIRDFPTKTRIQALGTVLCISPWNFPLAIFCGQIAAALAAGNSAIAKPAEQTPLIAAEAIRILWQAGIPQDVVQLLPGQGESVGAQLARDSRIQGIMFTGSTEVAKTLQQTIAHRINQFGESVSLIAETGGQNVMIVDSSALTEQVVLDVVNSAFDSAGQRCSALRVLCVQEDNIDTVKTMLKGAMQQLHIGQPHLLKTDIGPVIDQEAKNAILKHIDHMRHKGYPIYQNAVTELNNPLKHGTYVAPTLIELPNLDDLEHEVFGPVLHLIQYKAGELSQLLKHINAKGYGLTMGLHTRIDETAKTVMQHAQVGNLYINRNMVGAVVGVQPFGGKGLSGTGPKAGGPLYLYRLMHQISDKKLTQPYATEQVDFTVDNPIYAAFLNWVEQNFPHMHLQLPVRMPMGIPLQLQGPTGELNQYVLEPRPYILSIADTDTDHIHQLLAIFSIGSQPVILPNNRFVMKYLNYMPKIVQARFKFIQSIQHEHFDAVLHHGSPEQLMNLQYNVAQRQGPIVSIHHLEITNPMIPVERLVYERAISINTAAAGGNASLMTMAEQ